MKFSEFVSERLQPLLALRAPYGNKPEAMIPILRDLLIEMAHVKASAVMTSALAWMQSDAGEKIRAVCSEAATWEEIPTLPDMRRIWLKLFPPLSEVAKNCRRCNGTNWISVNGEHSLGASYPCSHGTESDADRRMGLWIPPSVASRYGVEMAAAEVRKEAWERNPANALNRAAKRAAVESVLR